MWSRQPRAKDLVVLFVVAIPIELFKQKTNVNIFFLCYRFCLFLYFFKLPELCCHVVLENKIKTFCTILHKNCCL